MERQDNAVLFFSLGYWSIRSNFPLSRRICRHTFHSFLEQWVYFIKVNGNKNTSSILRGQRPLLLLQQRNETIIGKWSSQCINFTKGIGVLSLVVISYVVFWRHGCLQLL